MVDKFEKFSFSISEIYRYWHKIASDEMERYGLKGPYAVYFTTMYRYSEGITAVSLGELCSKDKADVSRAISLLEKNGLVEREGTNPKGYRALIKLTEKGKQIAEHINEKVSTAVLLAGKGLSQEQSENFYYALDMISSNLKVLSEQGLSV